MPLKAENQKNSGDLKNSVEAVISEADAPPYHPTELNRLFQKDENIDVTDLQEQDLNIVVITKSSFCSSCNKVCCSTIVVFVAIIWTLWSLLSNEKGFYFFNKGRPYIAEYHTEGEFKCVGCSYCETCDNCKCLMVHSDCLEISNNTGDTCWSDPSTSYLKDLHEYPYWSARKVCGQGSTSCGL